MRYPRFRKRYLLVVLAVAGAIAATIRPVPATPSLQQVNERGQLVVATRPSLTTVYQAPDGPTGMDYQLAKGFANHLGVQLQLLKLNSITQVKQAVRDGRADFGAAALMIDDDSQARLRYTSPYQEVATLVVYRIGAKRPHNLGDLAGSKVVVPKGSGQAAILKQAEQRYPKLSFSAIDSLDEEKALAWVDQGKATATLINSNAYAIHRGLFPNTAVAFTLSKKHGLAWAFDTGPDRSLYQAAQHYLETARASGQTARLADRFYGHQDNLNRYAARHFLKRMSDRLPQYINDFRKAVHGSRFDWRLLAAMAYQESQWDTNAVSSTGVKGLMMVTLSTARAMGIQDRTDPAQSIEAGAAYLRSLYRRLPDHIQGPSRTWMALAAYNVGLGHLEDARVLTQSQGDDPDSWSAVRKRLPLLGDSQYASQLRHGPAPGGQAVVYVRNVRHYYNLLVLAGNSEHHRDTQLAAAG